MSGTIIKLLESGEPAESVARKLGISVRYVHKLRRMNLIELRLTGDCKTLLAAGYSVREISEALGLSKSTVVRRGA